MLQTETPSSHVSMMAEAREREMESYLLALKVRACKLHMSHHISLAKTSHMAMPTSKWESSVLPCALLCGFSGMKGMFNFTLLFPSVVVNATGRRA